MSSLFKLAHISKRVVRPVQLFQRHISTSKKNQEVCVTGAELTEQEQVIFLIIHNIYFLLNNKRCLNVHLII